MTRRLELVRHVARRAPLLGALTLGALLVAATAPSRAHGQASGTVTAASAAPSPSDASSEAARRARVVLTVGARTVTVGELEDHLAGIAPFQLETFGATREAIARAYVERVLVRDLVLAAGAEERRLPEIPPTKQLLERARSSATLRRTRAAIPVAAAIPEADVRKFYEDNRARFDSPERIHLWRILCATEADAKAVLEAVKADATTARFTELARDKSIDKATNLRGGNLGFLGPDGASNEAGVKVDAALVRASRAVKDGELVPTPVVEGENFAVVWRRGTVPATLRTLEEASAQIRATIYRERTDRADKELLKRLREENVKELHEELLGIVELRPFDAGLTLPRGSTPRP